MILPAMQGDHTGQPLSRAAAAATFPREEADEELLSSLAYLESEQPTEDHIFLDAGTLSVPLSDQAAGGGTTPQIQIGVEIEIVRGRAPMSGSEDHADGGQHHDGGDVGVVGGAAAEEDAGYDSSVMGEELLGYSLAQLGGTMEARNSLSDPEM